jgi:hypothetical protein
MTKNHPSLAIDPYYDGVPAYMTEVYDWAYVDPKWVRALDHNWVVRVLAVFERSATDARLSQRNQGRHARLATGACLWRSGDACGAESGAKGAFHLTDVTPIQIEHGTRKLAGMELDQGHS